MAWQPQWQLLVAFNNAAQDDPGLIATVATPAGTLGGANVWTDVTPWVMEKVDTNRGREHAVDRFQQGSMSATLRNVDGRFDSWNVSGPYTGKIAPGVPVQLRATFGGVVYYQFTGVADVWQSVWPQESDARVVLSCVDQFSYFNYALCNTTRAYNAAVAADSPVGFWKLGEPAGATVAVDSSGNNYQGHYAGTYTLGNPGPSLASTATSANFMPSGVTPLGGVVGIPAGAAVSGDFTVEAWVNAVWADAAATNSYIWQQSQGTPGLYQARVVALADGTLQLFIQDALAAGLNVTSNVTVPSGSWHHVAVTRTGTTVNMYLDGVSTATTVNATGSPVFATPTSISLGTDISGPPTFPGSMCNVAVYPSVLSAGDIAKHYNDLAPVAVEASGTRIGRALDWVGWPTAARTVDTGSSQMQAPAADLTTTTALSYMQTVEQSEMGALYMTGAGKARFMSRGTILTENQLTGSVATFGDGGGSEIPFELNPSVALDTLDQYTAAQLTRVGGVQQTAGTGIRTFQASGLLNTTDTEVLNYANWVVATAAAAVPRVRQVTVHPYVDPTGTATTALLGLDLMQIVTVNRHALPGGGTGFSQTAFVEGINVHVYPATGDWNIDFQLTPVNPPVWILGTSQLGVTTRLAW